MMYSEGTCGGGAHVELQWVWEGMSTVSVVMDSVCGLPLNTGVRGV